MFTLGTKQSTSFITNSGQSALEYMMTYGWAILIIVIVAVILYSMGIFTPSSSVSFSSSGFSPFTVSSSSCNSIGYKIAVIAGPIPNNANSLQITKVYVTSASGANTSSSVYTLPSPITLKSSQSAVIIVPNVACNAINVKYSFSAIIQYTYNVPSIGTQTINTSGTVAGTSIAGKPSILTSYEPLTITNTQTSATPSPFQQMINMTSTDPGWSSIATSNFAQNVEFFYYNGSIIPSWLENYTSSGAIWWLKLPSISNSMVIYMGFAPSSTSLFNTVSTGEAPQLSSTYAEYDDGASIFYSYAGKNTLLMQPYTSLQSNGVFFDLNNYEDTIALNSTDSTGILAMVKTYPISPASDLWHFLITGSVGNGFYCGQRTVGNGNNFFNGYGAASITINGGFGNPSNYFNEFVPFYYNFSNGVSILSIDNGQETGRATYSTSAFGSGVGSIQVQLFWNITVQYVALTNLPPNGVMPSVAFGSIS